MNIITDIINHLSHQWQIRLLSDTDADQLQKFLNAFDDFFLSCEGEKGSAVSMLNACPPNKDIKKDKHVLGIYEQEKLIGMIDLLQNYPIDGTWMIGYLLIHPDYRGKHIGSRLMQSLCKILKEKGILRLRCIVQDENPKALAFWLNNGFVIEKSIEQPLGAKINSSKVLEKKL